MIEIKNKVDKLANSWEHYKDLNDKRLAEIEKKGAADPITISGISKLNDNIEEIQHSIKSMQMTNFRPAGFEQKDNYQDLEHKKALIDYIRTGDDFAVRNIEKKSLSTSVESEGGYLLSKRMMHMVKNELSSCSAMRSLANITEIAGDALEVVQDFEGIASGWTLESELRNETATPKLSKKVIVAHEVYAQPKATQRFIDDISVNESGVEEWLAGKISESFLLKENDAFINGDGVGKPQGILKYSEGEGLDSIARLYSGSKANFTADDLIKLYYSIDEIYAAKSKFLMNRAAMQAVRMMKNKSNDQYIWQPNLKEGGADTILGLEVVLSSNMPGMEDGAAAIAFGDFKSAYQILDRQGVRILRDPYTEKPFIKFYATKRVGGGLVNGRALKLLVLK